MALTTNLVSYYKLDESSGNASDTVGANNLTNNGTTGYASALINNGIDLGTTNSSKWLSSSTEYGISATGAITISLWLKMRTEISSSEQCFLARSVINASGSSIQMSYEYNSGTRRVRFLRYGSTNSLQYYTITMGTANWHHFVVTFDGSTILGYVDGVQRTTEANSGTQSIGGTAMSVGATGGTLHTSAYMDEIGVWSRALSGAEVTSLYNSGAGLAYPFSTSNIKSYNQNLKANIKSINTNVIANVKSLNSNV